MTAEITQGEDTQMAVDQTGAATDQKVVEFHRHRGTPKKMNREERQRAVHRFAELLALGYNQTDAALKAGFGKHRRSASVIGAKLAGRIDVQRLIALSKERVELAPPDATDAEVDEGWIVSKLRYEAQHSESAASRVRALELLGKIKGIYAPDEQRVEHVGTLFADVDPDAPEQTASPSDGGGRAEQDLA